MHVLINGQEIENVGSIHIERDTHHSYPEIDCRYVDDVYHKCDVLGSRKVLINAITLRSLVAEIMVSREVIKTNSVVLSDQCLAAFEKASDHTDVELSLGAK